MKSQNYPKKNHSIIIIQRENEILLVTPRGKPIASLTVTTAEKDDLPSDDFFLQFKPEERNQLDKDLIYVKESE